ncbi:MAG: choice-of-anchor D domain-containing protein [bacterium]
MILFLVWGNAFASAVSSDGLWSPVDAAPAAAAGKLPWIRPEKFTLHALDADALLVRVKAAPMEFTIRAQSAPLEITLPNPEGKYVRFRIVESPIMEPELAAKFPAIKTYSGQGVDDPAANVRFDWTPQGFHASVLSPSGAWYIDPWWQNDTSLYSSYYKKDLTTKEPWRCLVEPPTELQAALREMHPMMCGPTLRTYRLANAATAEYTTFQSAPNPPNVAAGQAGIVTAINRINQVFEADLAIRLILIANNNLLVYTDAATQPYTNNDGGAMMGENQTNIDAIIGNANYDIGHVFSTGGGGVVSGRVCVNANKARGVTGSGAPTGDAFWIDYVAHEMGHQFNGMHTWNAPTCSGYPGQWVAATAMEPGSGSTIMSYAGICGANDLQPHSDPYFHAASLDEIHTYSQSGGGNACAVQISTGNSPPIVYAGTDYAIPILTPFTLTGTATDPDNDPLTYCWEELDTGAALNVNDPDNGASPICRSYNPTVSPSRTIPKLSDLINHTQTFGEKLPSVARNPMRFRLTARDNKAGGGGVNGDDMTLNVVGTAGPFKIIFPNTAVTCTCTATINWDVANTDAPPINVTQVNIRMSTDGGWTFPYLLTSNTPNDGSEDVALPQVTTTQARIKVEAMNNIFWAMSDANFTVAGGKIDVNTTVLDFGVNCPGETVDRLLQVFNTGCNELRVDSITHTGPANPAFVLVPANGSPQPVLPLTIAAGDHVDFTVRLTAPSAPGLTQATYRITSNDPNRPTLDVAVAGSIGSPDVRASIESGGAFGNICVGNSKSLELQVLNAGDCPVNITGITIAGSPEFTVSSLSSFPVNLKPQTALMASVTFTPLTFGGPQTATVTIATSDPARPTIPVVVTGTAPPPVIDIAPCPIEFGSVCPEDQQELKQVVSICNTGLCPMTIPDNGIRFEPATTEFKIVNMPTYPLTINGGGTCYPITIKFTPTSAGPKTATLLVVAEGGLSKSCTVSGESPDMSNSLALPVKLAFQPTVIQRNGPCGRELDLSIGNIHPQCMLTINSITITGPDAALFKIVESTLPSAFPVSLAPGEKLGDGRLIVKFSPTEIVTKRFLTAQINVTFVSDPAAKPPATITRVIPMAGEAVQTGMRVLVTLGGMPVSKVMSLQVSGGGPRITNIVLTNVPLKNVNGPAGFENELGFQYHAEYGGLSRPNQALSGNYRVIARIKDGRRMLMRTVNLSVNTCTFNPTLKIDF